MTKRIEAALPFDDEFLTVNQILASRHYLGPIDRGFHYRDEFGVMVLANPSSRRLPKLPPECTCDGGEQGEGMFSIPHEEHCPRGQWERGDTKQVGGNDPVEPTQEPR